MLKFPENLYTDVRIENVFETSITNSNGILKNNKVRRYKGAFIRIFDGQKWYYKSTTKIDKLQNEVDNLAKMTKENPDINSHPIVRKFEVNKDELCGFKGFEIDKVSNSEKEALLEEGIKLIKDKDYVKLWTVNYTDSRVEKEFYSSKGSNLKFDYQATGILIRYDISIDGKKDAKSSRVTSNKFEDLKSIKETFCKDYIENIEYVKEAKPIVPGKYTVVMAPVVAGVFAHESFGHKSEADFMIGDEVMMKEWSIGTKVGSDILSIYDFGGISVTGYCPYDDEGTKTSKTYLIKNGVLSGRLHSGKTAADMNEDLTGNGRAIDFEFEPIVRMTSTVIEGGEKSKEELISEIEEGVLLVDYKHGSGLSTFTIAPGKAYMIRNGKIGEPVSVAVATGNVMETLYNIDCVSKEVEVHDSIWGGCGKDEQFPLPVADGGPYVRVRNLQLQ